jgi:hypothetical protein
VRSVGVDLHEPWIEESRTKGIHHEYVQTDATTVADRFGARSFDAVLCCDLLEHLEKADGERLLEQAEAVARERVVILTPNGFVEQDATWGNPYQVHRSGWSAAEMRARGYEVHGMNGLRWLRGPRGSIRLRPARLWGLLARLSNPIVWRRPQWAFHILCVKRAP